MRSKRITALLLGGPKDGEQMTVPSASGTTQPPPGIQIVKSEGSSWRAKPLTSTVRVHTGLYELTGRHPINPDTYHYRWVGWEDDDVKPSWGDL